MNVEEYVKTLHPTHSKCPFVSKKDCENKTRTSKWFVGLFFGMLSVLLALVVYATGEAHSANNQYIKVRTDVSEHKQQVVVSVQNIKSSFETYKARQDALDTSVVEKLDEVKNELFAQRKEQRVLLEKILELQIEVARKQIATSE